VVGLWAQVDPGHIPTLYCYSHLLAMTLPDGASPSQVHTRLASRAPSLTLRALSLTLRALSLTLRALSLTSYAPPRAQERQALAEELLLRAVHAEPSVMVAPPSLAPHATSRAPAPRPLTSRAPLDIPRSHQVSDELRQLEDLINHGGRPRARAPAPAPPRPRPCTRR
jgi:hypothetical protein